MNQVKVGNESDVSLFFGVDIFFGERVCFSWLWEEDID